MDSHLASLEEKIAWLEHHVTGQDKVMLELADDLARFKQQVAELRGKLAAGAGEEPPLPDEQPPHY